MNARTDMPPSIPWADESVAQLRVPPHSFEAESSVLGGLLLDASAWDRVGDLLAESDFYRHEHRLIFGAIAALANANKPVDVVTVFGQLQGDGKAHEAGGMVYLGSLAQYVPSATNIRRYAEIVRERSVLRKLVGIGDSIASSAFNTQGQTVEAVVDGAIACVMALHQDSPRDDWQDIDTGVTSLMDALSAGADAAEPNFVSTGLAAIDRMLDGGARPGEVIVIGARPSMGKTALALTIGLTQARARFPVAMYSLEMPNTELIRRAVAVAGRVPMHMLRRPERMSDVHWSAVVEGVDSLRGIPFQSTDQAGININQLRSKARAAKRRHGLRILIVDYLQLMTGTDPRANRNTQLEEASRGLKTLAKELGITVIALAQVGREVEKAVDPMPRMADIKDCGGIEQDADVIVFIDRPIQRKPDLGPEWRYYCRGRVAKNRNGATGDFDLSYIGEQTRFADWSGDVPTSAVRVKKGSDL